MELCFLVIMGGVIGALARLIVPGKQTMGFWVTVLVGVVGTVLGSLLANLLDLGTLASWLIALGIATLLVFLVAGGQRRSVHRKSPPPTGYNRGIDSLND